jgi:hypothetical protein
MPSGMELRSVIVRLPADLLSAAERVAAERDVTLGQILRDTLRAEIATTAEVAPNDPLGEVITHPLRGHLAPSIRDATGWDDLQRRLRERGFTMREAGGGLAVHEWPGGARVCKASEIGPGYAALMRRFGEPFPGHRQTRLAARILGSHGGDDDPLIESF